MADKPPVDEQAVFEMMQNMIAGLQKVAEALGSTNEVLQRATKAIENLSDDKTP